MNLLKSFWILVLMFGFGIGSSFSQSGPGNISLKEAIKLAFQNRPDLQNQKVKEQLAGHEVVKAKSAFLPTFDLGVDARLNTQLQTNVIPGAAFGGNGADRKVQFGTPVNLQAFVQADQKILDPALRTNLNIAQTKVKTEGLNTKKALIDIQISIATAYYSLALAQEREKLSGENVALFSELEAQTKARLEQGNILATDLEKAGLDVKNARFQLKRETNNLALAKFALAKELGIAKDSPQLMAFGLEELEQQIGNSNLETNKNVEGRLEYQIEQNSQNINRLQLKKYDKDWLPRLNAYGYLAVQSFRSDLNITKEVYPFNYVGLKMSMPIFDAHKRRDNKTEVGFQLKQNENNLRQLENNINYERQSANQQIQTSMEALSIAKENRILAEKLYAKSKVKLEEAAGLKTEVLSSAHSVQDARNNYLSALYDLFVAHLNQLKAEGMVSLE